MLDKVERLSTLLSHLGTSFKELKTEVKAEQVIKAEDIIVGDNSNVNFYQSQFIMVQHVDRWLTEAKGITSEILQLIPSKELPLMESVKKYKFNLIETVLIEENNNEENVCKRLNLSKRQLRYNRDLMTNSKEGISQ